MDGNGLVYRECVPVSRGISCWYAALCRVMYRARIISTIGMSAMPVQSTDTHPALDSRHTPSLKGNQ